MTDDEILSKTRYIFDHRVDTYMLGQLGEQLFEHCKLPKDRKAELQELRAILGSMRAPNAERRPSLQEVLNLLGGTVDKPYSTGHKIESIQTYIESMKERLPTEYHETQLSESLEEAAFEESKTPPKTR